MIEKVRMSGLLNFAEDRLDFFCEEFSKAESPYCRMIVVMYYRDCRKRKDIARFIGFTLPGIRSELRKFRLYMKKTPERQRLLQFFEAYRGVAADYVRSQRKK